MNDAALTRRRAALRALASLAGGFGAALAPLRAAEAQAAPPEPIEFVALGDMPYGPDPIAGPAYRHLIDLINQAAPAFSIHVGDFKDGRSACSDGEYLRQWQHFQRFASALVYTPGDNDWLDCHRQGDDPLDRLQALRVRFFAKPLSLGKRPITVRRQADEMPPFARYRENLRWVHRGVVLATFHTVGPQNGFDADLASVRTEAATRELANAAWIAAAFDQARLQGACALVLATQAAPLVYPDLDHPKRSVVQASFATSIRDTLLPLAERAPFPVLLIHGDFHGFITDRPFFNAAWQPIANLWRLQVFGDPRIHAVRVRVQAGAPAAERSASDAAQAPFAFTPIWNPMSTDPRSQPHTGS